MFELPGEVRVSRSAHAVVMIAAMLGMTGCVYVGQHYSRLGPHVDLDEELEKLPEYISDEMLERVRADRMTVEQVKTLLGEPTAVGTADGQPAIGYQHCVSWSGVCSFWEPFGGRTFPATDALCQVVGVWFDEAGHANEAESRDWGNWEKGHCSLSKWLARGGGYTDGRRCNEVPDTDSETCHRYIH